MSAVLERINDKLGLSKALAEHFYRLLISEYVILPRMEVYRLRRALRNRKILIISSYSNGYHLISSDKEYYCEYFNIQNIKSA
jgi:hypothetical protein